MRFKFNLLFILVIFIVSFVYSPAPAPAADLKQVLILPFTINAEQDLAFLNRGMVSMLSYVLAAPGLGRRHMAAHPYDVINTHFVLPSGPVGDRLARSQGIPNVLSVHGGDLYDPSKFTSPHRHPLLRAWIRRLAGRADEVVGQSTNTLENLRRYYAPEIPGVRIPLGSP